MSDREPDAAEIRGGSGLASDDPRHGTHTGYQNHGCRCEPCIEAAKEYRRKHGHSAYHREWAHRTGRAKSMEEHLASLPEVKHGTETMYGKRGCRCDGCRAAAAAARRMRRHADPEATRAYDREYKRRHRDAEV